MYRKLIVRYSRQRLGREIKRFKPPAPVGQHHPYEELTMTAEQK